MKKLMSAVTVMASLTMAGTAMAQYQARGEDGICASPRLREFMNSRAIVSRGETTASKPGFQARNADGITASPRLRDTLEARKTVPGSSTQAKPSTYSPVGDDGIAASPRLRETLDRSKNK